MEERKMRRRISLLLSALLLLTLMSPQVGAIANLPDAMVLSAGDVASVAVGLPVVAEVDGDGVAQVGRAQGASLSVRAGEESGTAQVVFRLLGLVPVKTMTVTVEQPKVLIPGGRSLGVAIETEGVVVVGSSDLGNRASPARRAGVQPGDVIRSVNGTLIENSQQLSQMVSDGQTVELEIVREGEVRTLQVQPEIDPRDDAYRLGVWVRESTAGVGTLTFYDPDDGSFGALGHAITDVDTGIEFPIGEGAVYENEIVQITRGEKGQPGELTGGFFEKGVVIGEIEKNTAFGVFGTAEKTLIDDALYPEGLPIASRDQIHTGAAQILSTIDGESICAYDCEIEKLYAQDEPETRSMVVHITDEELLERAGGIVQGMSGSPILQDGKIVGAVTHVFINDPTRGYGVYIEWMLDAAG